MLHRRSDPERFDLYTRGSLYFISAMEPVLALALVSSVSTPTPIGLLAAGVALATLHAAVCILLVRAGARHVVDAGPRPDGLRALAGFVTLVGVVPIAVWPQRLPLVADDVPGPGYLALLGLVGFYVGALAAGMTTRRAFIIVGAALGAVVAVLAAAAPQNGEALATGIIVAAAAAIAAVSYRCSVWMLGIVWELDRSQQTQARLAVAEERLRFARDLHDVLGRNLAAIAVKTELAAQLARRGENEAAEQMSEVHRIAQDSLKEVRDVVRGYRTTDLDGELAGSRSLLEAAGVSCRIVGDAAGLPEDAQTALGWVVREGTTNVLRHSDASRCTIRLDRADRAVTLTMENDGVRGVPHDADGGHGLVGLAERLSSAGGTLDSRHRHAGSYVLEARVPLADGMPA
ncbi:MAG: sensor histidine kinase [Actinomycetota bacterium]